MESKAPPPFRHRHVLFCLRLQTVQCSLTSFLLTFFSPPERNAKISGGGGDALQFTKNKRPAKIFILFNLGEVLVQSDSKRREDMTGLKTAEVKEYHVEASVRIGGNRLVLPKEEVAVMPASALNDSRKSTTCMTSSELFGTEVVADVSKASPEAGVIGAEHSAVIQGCLQELESAAGLEAALRPEPEVPRTPGSLLTCSKLRSILMSSMESEETMTDTDIMDFTLPKDTADFFVLRNMDTGLPDDTDRECLRDETTPILGQQSTETAATKSSIFMTEFRPEDDTSFSAYFDDLDAEARRIAEKRRRNRTIDLHDLPSLVWAATVSNKKNR
jgi:hypothetical protein